ncbi:hypothetical protein DK419_17360 [Methylobacterium terrae]|uniref:Uncharacterized protein n=1 Tax=Methylobacterium terrae TaxID=2202827 RepID=A0A2U8WQU3_9HYPH|nr:hypothetical protein DK419_17360 [Methylobacterium terrae]
MAARKCGGARPVPARANSRTTSSRHAAEPRLGGRSADPASHLIRFPADRFAMRKSASLKRRAGW